MFPSPRSRLACVSLVLLGVLAGCQDRRAPLVGADGGATFGQDAANGDSVGSMSVGRTELPRACAGATTPPASLVCTGLYADIATKTVADDVQPYAPAVPLWSDGTSKQRWIALPPGEKIDNANPDEWVFPIGTKLWKEFSVEGRRIETRLWQKVDTTFWVDATYAWNEAETAATLSPGGDVAVGDGTYHIPTADECQKCHRGRTDRILGFEQVLLGLAGASGLTLERLIAEERLTAPPPSSELVLGDDGTGAAAPALAWLHVNCGTTCHNRNSSSTAWSTNLFLRLDATQLDGRPVTAFDTLTTTIGVPGVSTSWKEQVRITPQDPAGSLLYRLIANRGEGNQMPPIGSSIVDPAGLSAVETWIGQMSPPGAAGDAPGSTEP